MAKILWQRWRSIGKAFECAACELILIGPASRFRRSFPLKPESRTVRIPSDTGRLCPMERFAQHDEVEIQA
jgi:hypothetical protein